MSTQSNMIIGVVLLLGGAMVGCGDREEQDDHPMMEGPMSHDGAAGDTPDWMMSRRGMMDSRMMSDMRTIHTLLAQHDQIDRQVEDIAGGVRTITTSDDPAVTDAIRLHVQQMKQRMEESRPIRMMDPLFRELFEHADQIDVDYEEIEGGVRVVETSNDPQVVLLIRQHARRFVNEAAEQGMSRAMQPTPLPQGYEKTSNRAGTVEDR